MRYGFYLPTGGPTATRDGILALAHEGERLGLHSAMVADHIVFPVESRSTYPYRLDGKQPERRGCARCLFNTWPRGGCDGAAPARHISPRSAVPKPGADRKDGGLARCPV